MSTIGRSRDLRHILLRTFNSAGGDGGGFGFTYLQLRNALCRVKMLDATEGELRSELRDLAQLGLVKSERMEEFPDETFYSITARGRDFMRAGCPWDRIDDFSGKVL